MQKWCQEKVEETMSIVKKTEKNYFTCAKVQLENPHENIALP